MKKIIFIIIISLSSIAAQNFHSPQNKKLFADHLYCEGDYLRAVLEYQEYLNVYSNDTVLFKSAYGYKKINRFDDAAIRFDQISESSPFYNDSKLFFLESLLKQNKFELLAQQEQSASGSNQLKIIYLANLISTDKLIGRKQFMSVFNNAETAQASEFYRYKIDPPYKSILTAGILSALIPGAGKIYTGQISEGLTAFVITSLFAFISYNNFKHDHDIRGWIFAGTGILFYAGNIYGSAVSADNYNHKLNYEYNRNVLEYLESKNFYAEEHDFCK